MSCELEPEILKRYPAIARSPSRSLSKAVRELLLSCPRLMSQQEVSRVFCLSSRTLSRLMKKEGVSYRQIVDSIREQKAKEYLVEHRLNISTVSNLLGYAYSENFSKAFKAWTGCCPREYVRSRRMAENKRGAAIF